MTVQGFFGTACFLSYRNIWSGVTSSIKVQFCQANSDVFPWSADKTTFSSWLASCRQDSGYSGISLLSFSGADFRLAVSCLKSQNFLSVGRVFPEQKSPPAHTPFHPTPSACAVSQLPHSPLGQEKWSVDPSRVGYVAVCREDSVHPVRWEEKASDWRAAIVRLEPRSWIEHCAWRASALAFLHSKPSEAEKRECGREERGGYAGFLAGMVAGPW